MCKGEDVVKIFFYKSMVFLVLPFAAEPIHPPDDLKARVKGTSGL